VRLAEFIVENRAIIVKEWEVFARSLLPPGGPTSRSVCRDHADEILTAVVLDMGSSQSDAEQVEKSKSLAEGRRIGDAAHIHAVMRVDRGFRLVQIVAEFRALRASVLALWHQSTNEPDIDGVTRFNEAIDEALSASASGYTETMDRYRDQFIAVLGHDLRNPLTGIAMAASTLATTPTLEESARAIASRILSGAKRMDRMVCDLLDLTRTRLGPGLPIKTAPMDLTPVCQQVIAELGGNPDQPLRFVPSGDLHGEWDSDRMAQVLSNLVANAIQHGGRSAPVTLVVRDVGNAVEMEVHNEGPPLLQSVLGTMFEPMVLADTGEGPPTANLGLGLYIAEQIVTAHGGAIGVTSTEAAGTTFTVSLPRRRSGVAG
jgi:signal transduction histidine kinase